MTVYESMRRRLTSILTDEGYGDPALEGGELLIHPDPHLYGVWAARMAPRKGSSWGPADFLVLLDAGADEQVEPCVFKSWPPREEAS